MIVAERSPDTQGDNIVRNLLLRSCGLLIVILLLTACTRERETPEPTPPAATATVATTTVPDPEVTVEGSTSTADATDEPVAEGDAVTPEPEEAPTQDTFDYTVPVSYTHLTLPTSDLV